MPVTGVVWEPTEADRAMWARLRKTIHATQPAAIEWLEAVYEVRETRLWMITHATWEDFCTKELERPMRTVHRLLQARQDAGQEDRAPAQLDMTLSDQRAIHLEKIGTSLRHWGKRYHKVMSEMPKSELRAAELEKLDKAFINFAEMFERWMSKHGAFVEISRAIPR